MTKRASSDWERLRRKNHCTVDLLFDQFRNVPLCLVHCILYCSNTHF